MTANGVSVTYDEPVVRIRTAELPKTFDALVDAATEYFLGKDRTAEFTTVTGVIAHVRHEYTNYEESVRGLTEGEPRQKRSRATFDEAIVDTIRTKYGGVIPRYRRQP